MTEAKNLILKASAGTGKTFNLTTRIIQLLAQKDPAGRSLVSPTEILALTFSRAAAYEIYAKLVDRLAASAKTAAAAAETNRETGLDLTREDYSGLLRRVISTQHVDSIATLDSFILRMIQFLPLEFGFPGGVEILDASEQADAIVRATEETLTGTETHHLERLLKYLDDDVSKRSFRWRLIEMMNTFQPRIRSHSDLLPLDADTVCATLGIDPGAAKRPICALETALADHPEWETLEAIAGIRGLINHIIAWKRKDIVPARGPEGKFAEALLADPEGAVSYKFKKKEAVFPPEVRKAAVADLKAMLHVVLCDKVKRQLLALKLVKTIDATYDAQTRQKGRLTFEDLPWELHNHARKDEVLQSVEYHFDTRFNHWALDEFQDTSTLQWACLKNLVLSAAGDPSDRTVTVVGDLKQSIYAWRGGEERLFSSLMARPEFCSPYGDVQNLAISYRYEKHTCDFINLVFGEASILRLQQQINEKQQKSTEPLRARWLHPNAWMIHHPNTDKTGAPLARDCVRVLNLPKMNPDTHEADPLYEALGNEIERLWSLRAPLEANKQIPKETFAVLVMKNDQGEAIANELRARGLPAVWEGESAITDLPTVRFILALLQLADHPHDTLAWNMCACSPVRAILFPACETAEAVSASVEKQLTATGLTRTLTDWVTRCCKAKHGLDPLTKERLFRLVIAAETFEQRAGAEETMEDFLEFLNRQTFRTLAKNPSLIRIITIDRSKGLGFDHVFVPFRESKGFTSPKPDPYFNTQTGDDTEPWTIASIPKEALPFFPKLAKAYCNRIDEQTLAAVHKFYVALTRSKRSLTVLLQETTKPGLNSTTITLSSFLKETLAGTGFTPKPLPCGELIYQAGALPETLAVYKDPKAGVGILPAPDTVTSVIRRRLPSRSAGANLVFSDLFSPNYGRAAQRGSDIHDQYAAITWIDPANPKDDLEKEILKGALRDAFIKPDGPVELWVEHGYERIENNQWETGRFDRVVITGSGDARRAVIYDIKSNRRPKELPVDAFHARMKTLYTSQMETYRHALSALLSLPPEAIRLELLLLDTQTILPL